MPASSSPSVHPLARVVEVNPDLCVNCHACIAACPVKHCNNGAGDHVTIDANTCIGCGQCIDACHHKARTAVDDAAAFFRDIAAGKKMIAVVAPAVAAVFPDNWLRLNGWLRGLGIAAVFDVSFGAELTVKSYLEHIAANRPTAVIAQPCPALVAWIEIFKPELIPYLAPADSPMLHTMRMIRRFYRQYADCAIVVVSPCAAKRREFDATGIGDYNLTFNSILARLAADGKSIADFPACDYDNPPAERAVLFSTPGGLLETAMRWNPAIRSLARKIEGPHSVYEYLGCLPRAIVDGDNPLLIDCLNCELGCNGGPGTPNRGASRDKLETAVARRAGRERERYARDFGARSTKKLQKAVKKLVDKRWEPGLYDRTYVDRSGNISWKQPDETEILRIFARLEKAPDEAALDCGSCGYGSCHEMAVAIHNGLNRPDNCRLFKQRRVAAAISGSAASVTSLVEHSGLMEASLQSATAAIDGIHRNATVALESIADQQSSSRLIAESVTALAEAGKTIAAFSETIERIAAQTKLLALNAAIESAKAGDSGRGFAVVAGEVKELALASANAATEIRQRVSGMEKDTAETSRHVGEFTARMDDIRASQAQIADAVRDQADALRETGNQARTIADETENNSRRLTELLHNTN